MKYVVEGRKFIVRDHAITFAMSQAQTLDRSVEVHIEMEIEQPVIVKKTWCATLHPPGRLATAIKQPFNGLPCRAAK